jgi:hypothetical protein
LLLKDLFLGVLHLGSIVSLLLEKLHRNLLALLLLLEVLHLLDFGVLVLWLSDLVQMICENLVLPM